MISLLMLTQNRKGMVMRCIRSLLPLLDRDDVEWIILDQASVDGTAIWLNRLPAASSCHNLEIILHGNNLGVAGGRARLLKEARGDVLVFLDSDVVAEADDWLDRLIAPLKSPVTGLCGPGGHWVTMANGKWQWFAPVKRGYVGSCDVISGYCQAFQRDAIQGFEMDMAYNPYWIEDSDQCLWLRAHGYDIICTGNIGLRHIYAGSGDDGSGRQKFDYFARKWAGKGLIQAERETHD